MCVPIDKLEIGQILYGFACATNPNEIVSLYTYNPKEWLKSTKCLKM